MNTSTSAGGLSAALIGSLLLAGCSGPDAPAGDDTAPAPRDAVRAEADASGTTDLTVDADFTPVPQTADARLLAPGVDLRIVEIAQPDSLSADVLEEITGMPVLDDHGQTPDEVFPAEGQVFYAASYTSDDPEWEPRGSTIPESSAGVRLAGNDAFRLFSTGEGTMQRGVVVVSVPEDDGMAADHAVLEVVTDEASQQLSLLDGSRVASDVEHVYDSHDKTATLDSADTIDEEFTGWAGGSLRLHGGVSGAFLSPWLGREDGGDGWPGSGKTYLTVTTDWGETESTTQDESTMQLTLDDGTTVKPVRNPSGLRTAFDDDPVFEIPVDTETVIVTINPQVSVGYDREHSWDPFTAELTIG